ncbi:hypothetical protein VULLAG_LOCUS8431 [Vulpes lagopus]
MPAGQRGRLSQIQADPSPLVFPKRLPDRRRNSVKRATLPRGGPDTSSTERVTEGQERKTLVPRRW